MVQANDIEQRREDLGPAERIIQTLLTHTDHLVHNRPGMVTPDTRFNIGVRWEPVTHKEVDGKKVVYKLVKQGKKSVKQEVGTLWADGTIRNGARQKLAEYRKAGLFPEVAEWMYRQISEVWKMDNEFAARWASYAFFQEHRDLKTVLAAFMLVQSRKGDPVKEGGKVIFHDDDFRDIGEAMFLIYGKGNASMDPKLLLRARDLLSLPQIAEINRELGFGRSARRPFLGRWDKAVQKWLQYREDNPKLLEGAVRGGRRQTIMKLARLSGYKPQSPAFFQTLRWKQVQSGDGHRSIAIGEAVQAAETWEGLTEEQICQKIVEDKPSWKVVVGRVPSGVGITRAITAAAIEAGSFSNKDLIIATPTLEDLGLLEVQDIKERWLEATRKAEDMRAANIAARVKNKETKEHLDNSADTALKKAVEEVIQDLEIIFMVDISSSMQDAIEVSKGYIEKLLPGFPEDRLHLSVFNTHGKKVTLRHRSAAGVQQAFRGISASGGTRYQAGFEAFKGLQPKGDVLFFYVGDEHAYAFAQDVRNSGLNPTAMALVYVEGMFQRGQAVRQTCAELGIPFLEVDSEMFADAYAVPRVLSNLIASTPVGQGAAVRQVAPRKTLVDTILEHKLLTKPVWAESVAAVA